MQQTRDGSDVVLHACNGYNCNLWNSSIFQVSWNQIDWAYDTRYIIEIIRIHCPR